MSGVSNTQNIYIYIACDYISIYIIYVETKSFPATTCHQMLNMYVKIDA